MLKYDGFFGALPFRSVSNGINWQKEITSRKTYLGYEDNDHRYFKAKEINLTIIFEGRLKKLYLTALQSMWENNDKQVLILLKHGQIFKNMVIKNISNTQEYDNERDNIIELNVSFQEMRYGVPGGNIYDDIKNVTQQDSMFTQVVGITKEKLNNIVNLYSRAIK